MFRRGSTEDFTDKEKLEFGLGNWRGAEPNCAGLNGPKATIQAGNLTEHKGGR